MVFSAFFVSTETGLPDSDKRGLGYFFLPTAMPRKPSGHDKGWGRISDRQKRAVYFRLDVFYDRNILARSAGSDRQVNHAPHSSADLKIKLQSTQNFQAHRALRQRRTEWYFATLYEREVIAPLRDSWFAIDGRAIWRLKV